MSKSTIIPDRYDKAFVQGLIDRIAALEKLTFKRGEDVVIGVPTAVARQSSRVPRLIIVQESDGRTYHVRMDAATLVADEVTL